MGSNYTQEVQLQEVTVDNDTSKPPVPVIILSAAEDREIPEPFPFPVTYGSDIDAALRLGFIYSQQFYIYVMMYNFNLQENWTHGCLQHSNQE